jgi:hypothetical protein
MQPPRRFFCARWQGVQCKPAPARHVEEAAQKFFVVLRRHGSLVE